MPLRACPGVFYTRVAPTPLPDPYLVAASRSAADLLGLTPVRLAEPDLVAALLVIGRWQAASPWPRSTRVTSSACTCRASAMAGPCCSAKPLVRTGGAGKCNSRARERHPIRAWGTARGVALIDSPSPSPRGHARPWHPDHPRACGDWLRLSGHARSVETAPVVTRLAPTFIRFGSFEYFYWTQQHDALKQLADFVIDRYYPECRAAPQPYLAWLEEVSRRTARLVAQWQGVGFCHGVLNTDNMSILGLTIDYGPYGFIDAFDAGHVCNHSDEHGRYAYDMQPQIGHWNLYALGQALVPLTDDLDATKATIGTYLDSTRARSTACFRAELA